jgi:electron transfer flavoprotein beta subunit
MQLRLFFQRGKMKILVAVKRVIDPYVKIRVKSDQSGVETDNIKMSMNPFDEIALEEAIRLREQNHATEIIAISIGNEAVQETLRHALALGADKAILVKTNTQYESLNIAKILQKIINDEDIDLVLMGKQSIDGDNNQTPQMLAALLDWPQATFASKIVMLDNTLEVTREIDGGLETIQVNLPAIVSTDLRLNEPRYASLPNIMKAKAKSLQVIEVDDLGLSLQNHREILSVQAPATRRAGIKVDSVDALLDKLRHEAKVL